MTSPSFATLVDWVDGRLDAAAAAAVRGQVEASEEATSTVEWIRSFRAVGEAMALEAPPEGLRDSLREIFGHRSTDPTEAD